MGGIGGGGRGATRSGRGGGRATPLPPEIPSGGGYQGGGPPRGAFGAGGFFDIRGGRRSRQVSQQANLQVSNTYTYSPMSRIHFPMDGTVVAIYWPEDDRNQSKREIEYDVQPTMPGVGRIRNVPLAIGVKGLVDDDEFVLKPSQLIVDGGTFDLNKQGGSLNTDGDRVLLQFVNGSIHNPVITHVLTHSQKRRNDKAISNTFKDKTFAIAEGPVDSGEPSYEGTGARPELAPVIGERNRQVRVNGTRAFIDNRGDVFINLSAHPDDGREDVKGGGTLVEKRIVVQNEGVDLLKIEMTDAGVINFIIAEEFVPDILVKVGDGGKSVAIAEHLKTLWGEATPTAGTLKEIFDNHIHTTTAVIATGGAFGVISKPTTSAPAYDDNITSSKVKILDG